MKTERSYQNQGHRLIQLPALRDCRGTLCFVEQGVDGVPFDVARVFWIYGVPQGQRRGYHAHRTCSELLVAVNGHLQVTLTDAAGSVTYSLTSPSVALLIPPMCWCSLHDFSENVVCVCMADEHYDKDGYIHDFEQFRQEIGMKGGSECK